MVLAGQDRDRIALRLPVQLREHRADPLEALPQARFRHGRGPVEDVLEARHIPRDEVRVVEQCVDHRGDEEGEADPLALDRREHGRRVEPVHEVHGAALRQGRADVRARDVAHGRDEQVARRVRELEVREDVRGGRSHVELPPRHALGTAGRPARVVEDGPVVVPSLVAEGLGTHCTRGGLEVLGELGRTEGPGPQTRPGGEVRELAAALRMVGLIDHQGGHSRILDLEDLVRGSAHRVQPGDVEAQRLHRDAQRPDLEAVGTQCGDTVPAVQPGLREHRLVPADEVEDLRIRVLAGRIDERHPLGVPLQDAPGLGADRGAGEM